MTTVNDTLKSALDIDGAIAAALVDYETGMSLGSVGGGTLDLDVAAAGNTDVVRAELKTLQRLGLDDTPEDVLITLGTQLHLLRLLQSQNGQGLFLYLVLDRSRANLAMARRQLTVLERNVEI
ncbi:hypothetical protein [Kineococcus rhizosphaerae]|uniref:Roadblock/LC7 domain-containing protein n=1 Tax=Kineococcus rhizosphaerae TaxID=559628 RepID=A0A2T0R014_9ACTN|nr:hypothetical protein [Kineococcus rhizosphaerae]PRY12469.1 hypothetical protein CLV37_11029 [Kineococcus rhizosphaerae]